MFLDLWGVDPNVRYILDTSDWVVERWRVRCLTALCEKYNLVIEGFNTRKHPKINIPLKRELHGGERLIFKIEMDMTLNGESFVGITYIELDKNGLGSVPCTVRLDDLGEHTDLSMYHFGSYRRVCSKLECVSEDEDPLEGVEMFYGFSYQNGLRFSGTLPYDISIDLTGGNLLLGDFILKIVKNGAIEV